MVLVGLQVTPICTPGGGANVINDEASTNGVGTFYDDVSTPGSGGTPTHDEASTPAVVVFLLMKKHLVLVVV